MNPLQDGYALQSVAVSACPHADARQAAAIAETCFQSARDPTQMPIDDATVAWLLGTVPAYWNLIKYQGVVIGSTLILPTSRVLMQRFLCAELTEAELWAALRQTPIRSAECGYLAGASPAGALPAARVGPGQLAGFLGPLPGARLSPARYLLLGLFRRRPPVSPRTAALARHAGMGPAGAAVGAGLPGRIMVEDIGQGQLVVAVALEWMPLFDGSD